MKNVLLTMIITWLCLIASAQVYYGSVIKSENFDNATTFATFWKEVNATAGDEIKLKFTNPESDASFNTIVDPTSVTSGYLELVKDCKPMITITSGDINLAGKSNIAIGFFGKEMYSIRANNDVYFKLEITKDGGTTWVTLFDADKDSRDGATYNKGWYMYKYFLPADYDGKTIKARFVVDGAQYSGWGSERVYFDNFFVSERFQVDPIITNVNYSLTDYIPTKAGYSTAEPIKVDFTNGGKTPITSIKMYYQIGDNAAVAETYTPTTPIITSGTGQYTFTAKADLSAIRQLYTIKTWVEIAGDGDMNNNTLTAYAECTTTDVPYIPRFLWTEGGTGYMGPDEWQFVAKEGSEKWDLENEFDVAYWSIKHGSEGTDAYLITRPIHFKSGKTYEIKFDAFTNSSATAAEKCNKIKVYASDNINLTNMTELYSNQNVDNLNARDKFARYKATKTGAQYFVFYCNSPATADEVRLQNMYVVEPSAIDAGISTLVSPVMDKFEYTAAETVSVKVRNFGMNAIAANAVIVKMQQNDGTIVTETVSSAIPAGAEVIHTFTVKIDLTNQGMTQILKVWTILANDVITTNDAKEYKLESIVTGIPYMPSEEKDYKDNWVVEDRNADKQMFVLANDYASGKWIFKYGGNSGYPMTNIMKSDEALYSRPLKLLAANTYRVSYMNRVDKETMSLKLDLYKIDGTTKTLVKNISTVTIDNTTFGDKECIFQVPNDGIYEVVFVVEMSTTINYKVYIGDFKFSKISDYDLMISESLMPGSSISCYNNFPVGILVKNDGLKSISSFKIKATSTSFGTKEKTFSEVLEPGKSKACYFDDNFVFSGTAAEELSLSVVLDNDQNITNNTITASIEHVSAETVPYICALSTALDYLAVNNNKDNSFFKKFTSGTGMAARKGVEYVGANDIEANDEIITKCLTLESGKIYSLGFVYAVINDGDIASLDVSLWSAATSSRIDITALNFITSLDKTNFTGYFSVPANGDYSVCIKVSGVTNSLQLLDNISIKAATAAPDIEVTAITVPVGDAVFTNAETVTATFKNVGTVALSSIPFTCDVNGKIYHAIFTTNLAANKEATISFSNIDLLMPGDYTIKVTAKISGDITNNNTATKTIKSLPIIDLTMLSIDNPKSGSLKANQQITISIKNSGKGVLTNIPVSCTVSDTKVAINGVIPGPLNDGETIQYTFPETVNMYEEKTYNISVTVTVAGDINVADNTISTSVICTQAPFDAGVTAILSPVDGLLTATETVKIKVKNYCTVDLFDVPVKAIVGTQTITGSLAKIATGEEVEYTFTQTVDMLKFGIYTVKAATILADDVNTENDEYSKDIKSWKIDVGVIDILSPVSGENMGIEQIKIVVKNFGDVAVTNIPVKYKVATMPQQGTITSEIAPGGTVEFIFSSTYDFSDAKTYTITAYTEYALDMDNTNDQFAKEITNTKKKIDVAITTLVTPVSGELTVSEAITVTVKNLGEAPIKDMPIECNVDGIVAKEIITATLAIGAEMNYTFTKKYDMSVVKQYNVKVTLKVVGDSNKANDVIEKVIENTVGVNDVDETLKLSIYPNPVRDILNIEGDYTSLEIYNTSGKLILTSHGETKVDVSNLTNGIYIINAYKNDKTIHNQKLIIHN